MVGRLEAQCSTRARGEKRARDGQPVEALPCNRREGKRRNGVLSPRESTWL
jgi:hypothetical protein